MLIATDILIRDNQHALANPSEASVFWLALAAAQWECGRLEARVREEALKVLSGGSDLLQWDHDPKLLRQRRRVLERLDGDVRGSLAGRQRQDVLDDRIGAAVLPDRRGRVGHAHGRVRDVAQDAAVERAHRVGVAAVGVAAFGPLDLDPESASYGTVRSTPKRGWQRAPVLALVRAGLDVPVAVDTDVGAAAVGEWRWGAARGVRVAAYVTVGTGIGAGIVVDGHPFHGLGHPEFGHIPAARDPEDELTGVCPVHGDCLEGLASGPAIAARWGRPSEALPADHPAWDLEARYLGRALATLTLTVVPGRIVRAGGGVLPG